LRFKGNPGKRLARPHLKKKKKNKAGHRGMCLSPSYISRKIMVPGKRETLPERKHKVKRVGDKAREVECLPSEPPKKWKMKQLYII
jgi:hypothetical protein